MLAVLLGFLGLFMLGLGGDLAGPRRVRRMGVSVGNAGSLNQIYYFWEVFYYVFKIFR